MPRTIFGICGGYFLAIVAFGMAGQASWADYVSFSYVKYEPLWYSPLLVGGVMGYCWHVIAKEGSGSDWDSSQF